MCSFTWRIKHILILRPLGEGGGRGLHSTVAYHLLDIPFNDVSE